MEASTSAITKALLHCPLLGSLHTANSEHALMQHSRIPYGSCSLALLFNSLLHCTQPISGIPENKDSPT
eukprot:1160640-Pelagomonas_calceolata.AAC.8